MDDSEPPQLKHRTLNFLKKYFEDTEDATGVIYWSILVLGRMNKDDSVALINRWVCEVDESDLPLQLHLKRVVRRIFNLLDEKDF